MFIKIYLRLIAAAIVIILLTSLAYYTSDFAKTNLEELDSYLVHMGKTSDDSFKRPEWLPDSIGSEPLRWTIRDTKAYNEGLIEIFWKDRDSTQIDCIVYTIKNH
jgi:hypothetical protein